MRIFGFDISLQKSQTRTAVDTRGGGWFSVLRESFAGAFQSNVTVDTQRDVLSFSAVFSCVTIIASDIAKLCINLKIEDENGICSNAPKSSPFWKVLRKPNKYQNRIKFIEQWIVSKLLYGNTYVLKQRDKLGTVVGLYILNAERVTPLVAENGDVYYQLNTDHLSGLLQSVTVPASEIIHDMMVSLWHPLVGVSPIFACGMSATMGNRIQKNSAGFFENMSRPSGMLSAPAAIGDETAARLKAEWEKNFSGNNVGRLAVLGDGLKYEAMTIPAVDAQLIQQLNWTVEDVARSFHVPLFKIGAAGSSAGNLSIEAQQQMYLNDCLQVLIESLELSLEEGLSLPADHQVEVDEEGLLRMDSVARADVLVKYVGGGIMAPNEARKKEDMKPKLGGDTPYLQQQNYSLAALAKRDAQADPFAKASPTPVAPTAPTPEEQQAAKQAKDLLEYISKGLACSTT